MKRLQGGRIVDFDPFATEVEDAPTVEPAPAVVEPRVTAMVPDGTVSDVLDWVGDDEDRRRAALAAELAADKPRKSLIERLT